MYYKNFVTLLFFIFYVLINHAQLNSAIIGDAIDQGDNCFIITQDQTFQAGGVWYDNPINFDNDFTILYQNNFGDKDADGADGMALVFKPDSTPVIGGAGGGLGYEGISPSLVVEFDTYLNNSAPEGLLGDPFLDHISIMRDGNPNHNSITNNLAGPVQASPTSTNIEDGNTHEIKIEWIASTTTLNVYFDCQLRLSLNQDVKNSIFSGDNSVFFGFVGSTGGLSNIHQVCFNSISFVDNLQLQDQILCENTSVEVDASTPSGVTYSWLPTNGVSNPNIANPIFSPNVTTTYTVTIADVCGNTTVEEFTLSVLPIETPVFNAVGPICLGDALTPLPTISNNGIEGIWSPALNNTQTTTYTFTPSNPCANSTTLEIVVNVLIIPTFNPVPPICEGGTFNELSTISNNGITGTWTPAIDNTNTTTYTFVPDTGQGCVASTTIQITLEAPVVPMFDPIDAICEGENLVAIPTISNNGIEGTWSPALDNTITTTYTFTPSTDQCATLATLEIIVNAPTVPDFDPINPICEGDSLFELPTISNNGIEGTWSPALNNITTTTYTFTPNLDECATQTNLEVVVIAPENPTFNAVNPICEGEPLPPLPVISNNGITGTWSPDLNSDQTTTYIFTPDSNQCANITQLTVVVIPNEVPVFDSVNPICPGDFLDELPLISNNGIEGTWSPALDNTVTTVYTFIPDIGQGCVEETTLQIEVLPPVIPTFNIPSSICLGDTTLTLPLTSNEGITGVWSEPINNQETTIYTFTPDPFQCASSVNIEIEVLPISQLNLTIEVVSEPFSSNQTIVITVTGGNGEYQYQLDNGFWVNDNVFTNINGCDEHSVNVRQLNGCSITANETFRILDYPKYFTPNGDNFNGFWNIDCLKNQAASVIYIFDRFGKLLKTISPNSLGWNGSFNGNLMPTDDYWFRAEYFDSNGNPATFASHFTLKR